MQERTNTFEGREPAMSYFYKGRHRLDSNHPDFLKPLATSAVIASALVGLNTANVANAAPDEVWDRLAECESSGNWAINTGNGYSGGLQFSPSTWDGFRPSSYPSDAFQASREQQILVAERVLASQGWGAWPACSRRLGLAGQPVTPREVAAQPTTITPNVSDVETPSSSSTPTTPTPRASPSVSDRIYTVVTGDSLSKIVLREHLEISWQELYQQNRDVVEDPDLIYPGELLNVS